MIGTDTRIMVAGLVSSLGAAGACEALDRGRLWCASAACHYVTPRWQREEWRALSVELLLAQMQLRLGTWESAPVPRWTT